MFYTFTTIDTLLLGNILLLHPIHVSEWKTQITAHDWDVDYGYKRFVAALTVHISSLPLLESKRHLLAWQWPPTTTKLTRYL